MRILSTRNLHTVCVHHIVATPEEVAVPVWELATRVDNLYRGVADDERRNFGGWLEESKPGLIPGTVDAIVHVYTD